MINMELPLSWMRLPLSEARFHSIALKHTSFIWLAMGDVPYNQTFTQTIDALPERNYVIRGCTPPIAAALKARGWQCLQSGMEATLDLQHLPQWSRKLRHCIRRGKQKLQFTELPLHNLNARNLQELEKRTSFAGHPRLRHVFRWNEPTALRLFVARDRQNEWQAAFTLSLNAPGRFQGELMLRHSQAPYGAMEALIAFVVQQLQNEGISQLSLGEVPFLLNNTQNLKETVIHWGGISLLPVYNYKGLHFFKDKFKPNWRAVYLCATPALHFRTMAELLYASGTLSLWKTALSKAPAAILPPARALLRTVATGIPALLQLIDK